MLLFVVNAFLLPREHIIFKVFLLVSNIYGKILGYYQKRK